MRCFAALTIAAVAATATAVVRQRRASRGLRASSEMATGVNGNLAAEAIPDIGGNGKMRVGIDLGGGYGHQMAAFLMMKSFQSVHNYDGDFELVLSYDIALTDPLAKQGNLFKVCKLLGVDPKVDNCGNGKTIRFDLGQGKGAKDFTLRLHGVDSKGLLENFKDGWSNATNELGMKDGRQVGVFLEKKNWMVVGATDAENHLTASKFNVKCLLILQPYKYGHARKVVCGDTQDNALFINGQQYEGATTGKTVDERRLDTLTYAAQNPVSPDSTAGTPTSFARDPFFQLIRWATKPETWPNDGAAYTKASQAVAQVTEAAHVNRNKAELILHYVNKPGEKEIANGLKGALSATQQPAGTGFAGMFQKIKNTCTRVNREAKKLIYVLAVGHEKQTAFYGAKSAVDFTNATQVALHQAAFTAKLQEVAGECLPSGAIKIKHIKDSNDAQEEFTAWEADGAAGDTHGQDHYDRVFGETTQKKAGAKAGAAAVNTGGKVALILWANRFSGAIFNLLSKWATAVIAEGNNSVMWEAANLVPAITNSDRSIDWPDNAAGRLLASATKGFQDEGGKSAADIAAVIRQLKTHDSDMWALFNKAAADSYKKENDQVAVGLQKLKTKL